MKRVTVYGLKIDNDEIKTTEWQEILKFVRMNRRKSKTEITQVSLDVPEDRLKNVLENVSVKELYDYTENRKKNVKTTKRYTDLDKAVNNVAEKMILADTIKSGNLENDIEMASEIVDTMQDVLSKMFGG